LDQGVPKEGEPLLLVHPTSLATPAFSQKRGCTWLARAGRPMSSTSLCISLHDDPRVRRRLRTTEVVTYVPTAPSCTPTATFFQLSAALSVTHLNTPCASLYTGDPLCRPMYRVSLCMTSPASEGASGPQSSVLHSAYSSRQ